MVAQLLAHFRLGNSECPWSRGQFLIRFQNLAFQQKFALHPSQLSHPNARSAILKSKYQIAHLMARIQWLRWTTRLQ